MRGCDDFRRRDSRGWDRAFRFRGFQRDADLGVKRPAYLRGRAVEGTSGRNGRARATEAAKRPTGAGLVIYVK